MRVTIFGATGLLGKALMRAWDGDEVVGLGSKDADIRDSQRMMDVAQRTRPDWIVLAAAYTDVDGCEANRDLAFEVNCRGAINVAQAAHESGARLLFVSTDYVFDGNKAGAYEIDDLRSPVNVYGKSKADAEVALLRLLPECCIVRTSWLFGPGGKCFPETILKLAAGRKEIDVVDDQRGCPTYAPDLARAIAELCRRNAAGIVHATNRGVCTWFEFAREIVAESGLQTVVRATTSDKFVRPARRPKNSVLSAASLAAYGIEMPSWQHGLHRYLAEKGLKTRLLGSV
ncbi:MAG: dTDP-4-dehydrorhamnose reductase [Acidobacteriia bacterium]|nr:dTDP-4-dehydrorhamnose reductase [Terriglobia bacterium]